MLKLLQITAVIAGLLSGDLFFEVSGNSDSSAMDGAISQATSRSGFDYVHVGIVEVDSLGCQWIIDASPAFGVSRRPLEELFDWNDDGVFDKVHFYRLRSGVPEDFIKNVKAHLGEEYDWGFLPDNGRMYCSELVHACCLRDGKAIFEAEPMNFLGPDGELPEYWRQLFASLGQQVPQGVPGTNPNSMALSSELFQLGLCRGSEGLYVIAPRQQAEASVVEELPGVGNLQARIRDIFGIEGGWFDFLMEIFAFLTGILYIIFEIKQKNLMWVVGIVTAIAAMYMFRIQGLYASYVLNLYYLTVSFAGLYRWRRDAGKLSDALSVQGGNDGGDKAVEGSCERSADKEILHLNRLAGRTVLISAGLFVGGVAALVLVLRWLGDPMSSLDAAVAVLSAIATWWLACSYKEQWMLWIVADSLSTLLCLSQGMYWMAALYLAYTLSAVYGYFYWKRHGRYI